MCLRSTVWNLHPSAAGKAPGGEFLCRHHEVPVAVDFFTIEAWTRRGLTRFLVLSSSTFRAGGWRSPDWRDKANGLWISQVARNFTDDGEGFLVGKRYLTHDQDPFTAEFQRLWRPRGAIGEACRRIMY